MQNLLNVMRELREKCPWDQKQTPESLTRYAIEEAYEVEAAVRTGNVQEIRDELGDLLLQVVFQSQMYSEQGAFDFHDVVQAITEKLIRRHPHVFKAEEFSALSSEDVAALWQQIKQQEKQGLPRSRLDEIKHGPALNQADQIQKNVAKIGFDFPDVAGAYGKLEEELAELQEAIAGQNSDEIEEEFGDCLFSLVNVGRKLGLSSEQALLGTIHKFRTRFALMEHDAAAQQLNIENLSLAELDQLWKQAKLKLKQRAVHEQTNPTELRED
ncbi:nucleoside triphosphate pyrophosphohydrolase [Acinetobacter sp. NCu2D-2]|uniref:nucleoside triphosphate pyrophosphohydrolase n=1 Tax=Acinetobacter sp. NCu2D-2 TaxID=1608473 RepID=UPI0007CDEFEA|nr:nucleoside triphosphate pyrophosphohydrolase [Acinetobacter sp. NCu2D-2]ANF81065.1 nucleoside triphosphate pyrophosphohydrolase [Acinetobacter sp. NCu2D-2]